MNPGSCKFTQNYPAQQASRKDLASGVHNQWIVTYPYKLVAQIQEGLFVDIAESVTK